MKKKILRRSPTKTPSGRRAARPVVPNSPDAEFSYALIHHKVCRLFEITKVACAGQSERGGILIGCHRGPHLEVTDCTEPGREDLASLSSFTRIDAHHQNAATDAWHKSKGTVTYVGEWHSHPFGSPQPSSLDCKTWRNVVKHLKTPCLFVIVSPIEWQTFRIRRLKIPQRNSSTVTSRTRIYGYRFSLKFPPFDVDVSPDWSGEKVRSLAP